MTDDVFFSRLPPPVNREKMPFHHVTAGLLYKGNYLNRSLSAGSDSEQLANISVEELDGKEPAPSGSLAIRRGIWGYCAAQVKGPGSGHQLWPHLTVVDGKELRGKFCPKDSFVWDGPRGLKDRWWIVPFPWILTGRIAFHSPSEFSRLWTLYHTWCRPVPVLSFTLGPSCGGGFKPC